MARVSGPAGGVHTGGRGEEDRSSPAEPCPVPPASPVPPARASAYIPPTAVPRESKYHTIDMKAVRLSPEIDPARMQTQLSLKRVQVPVKSRRRSLTALTLLGVSIGVGGFWGVRSQVTETAVATGLPGSTSMALSVQSSAAGSGQALSAPAAAAVRTTQLSHAPDHADPHATDVGPRAASVAASARTVLSVTPVSMTTTSAPNKPAWRKAPGTTVHARTPTASSSAHGSLQGPSSPDTNRPAGDASKVWVAPSEPKAWLK